jgi:hypothetical protein
MGGRRQMVRRGIDPQLAEALLAARWGLRGLGQAQYLWSFLPQFQQAGVLNEAG